MCLHALIGSDCFEYLIECQKLAKYFHPCVECRKKTKNASPRIFLIVRNHAKYKKMLQIGILELSSYRESLRISARFVEENLDLARFFPEGPADLA